MLNPHIHGTMNGEGVNGSTLFNNTSVQYVVHYGWSSWFYWGYFSYHICAEFVGLILGLSVLLTIFCSRTFRTLPNYYLLVNLAVGYAAWISTTTPFNMATFVLETWPFGRTFCIIYGFWTYTLAYQSMVTLALMAVDRYQSLVNALHYRQFVTRKKHLCFCIFSWVYAATVALPPVFGLGKYIYEQSYFGCHFDWSGVHSKYSNAFRKAIGASVFCPHYLLFPLVTQLLL